MLTAKKIQVLITNRIRGILQSTKFEKVMIVPEDENPDMVRPALKITTDTKYDRQIMIKTSETTTELFFYAEDGDNNEVDCLEMQELLCSELVDGFELDGEKIYPENMDCSISGGVLAIVFTLIQEWAEATEPEEDMEELNIEI